jgi:hypothetical protein
MNSIKAHKHAILLAALVWVVFVQSFRHRDVLGPVLSDLTLAIVMLLVFMVVFYRRSSRLVACIALATAIVADSVHYALPGSRQWDSVSETRNGESAAQAMAVGQHGRK